LVVMAGDGLLPPAFVHELAGRAAPRQHGAVVDRVIAVPTD
jgi:hypothetical protein